ncbi:MAG TPA: adenylate/guanylate cyclase domain-containing protein [Candidatus Binatia bacterium]|nr:adenylate/guanylate cyclase domain-containing protein [Candidatus Binatia bacterium]
MANFFRSPPAAAVVIGLLLSLAILGLRGLGILETLELTAYDLCIRFRPDVSGPDPRIVLVTVTEDDIRKQGRWPLADDVLAQALEILSQSHPRAIGVDIYRDIPVPPGHERLNAILTKNPRIIVTTKFADDPANVIPPPPVLKDTEQVGFNDVPIDPDGIVRRGLLIMDDGKQTLYSFSLRQALLYLQAEGISPQPDPSNPEYLRLGQTTFRPFESNDGAYVRADAAGYQLLLDFKGFGAPLRSFTLTALLSGEIDPVIIKDRVVLIGVNTESVKDFFYTPHSRGLQGQPISGVALHAQIVSQFLRSALEATTQVATPTDTVEAGWIILWGVMGGALGLWVRSPWRFFWSGGSGLLILAFGAYFAFLGGWWIPSVPPGAAWLGSAALVTTYMLNQEKKERALLMQLFSRHVAPEVAESIWQQRDQFMDGGRPRSQKSTVTVLFTDLRGFTSVSEKMDPQALLDWLNVYMEAMAQLVMEHGGVVDNYIGDSIKADFGVPLPRTGEAEISRDAVSAVNCALAMERELKRLNAVWQQQNLPTVEMRVGIFTGPVVAGSLGSAQRLKYTTVGDTVNIASRLESFDKDLVDRDLADSPCRILIGETTLQYLDHQFLTKRVGEANLKGKDEKVTIYRVIGRTENG